jgi:threonylcarbamoyladenosine tRNA methylthiotransferase MtaB
MRTLAINAGCGNETIIFNTCTVTGESERQVRQAVRKARRENRDARIVVTGCSVQANPEAYSSMDEVDHVIGNDLKLRPESWQELSGKAVLVDDIMDKREVAGCLIEGMEGRARAFMQVQTGCDHRCTFCIIPYTRGPARSAMPEDIAAQAQKLVDGGYNEIVLTGVDITSYGFDLTEKFTLGQMVRKVLERVPDLPRLRLSSLDPVEIDEDLWTLIGHEPRLMPHLHLSVQAGDDMILKRMKRRHSRQDVINICNRARKVRPDMVFGADIITGFPTETEEMFENTLDMVRECDIALLHVFPYSPRPGTPAARMPQAPAGVRKERAARLRKLGEDRYEKTLGSYIDKNMQVIVEQDNIARTGNFLKVILDRKCPPGSVINVRTCCVKGNALLGRITEKAL